MLGGPAEGQPVRGAPFAAGASKCTVACRGDTLSTPPCQPPCFPPYAKMLQQSAEMNLSLWYVKIYRAAGAI